MDDFYRTGFEKYSASQPRDDHGRWTSGGGSASSSATMSAMLTEGNVGSADLQGVVQANAAGERMYAEYGDTLVNDASDYVIDRQFSNPDLAKQVAKSDSDAVWEEYRAAKADDPDVGVGVVMHRDRDGHYVEIASESDMDEPGFMASPEDFDKAWAKANYAQAAYEIIGDWGYNSNAAHALDLQNAAEGVLGRGGLTVDEMVAAGGKPVYASDIARFTGTHPFVQAYVKSTYAHTQARLAEAGVKSVTLVRGLRTTSPLPTGTTTVRHRPVSSFSTDEAFATRFASGFIETAHSSASHGYTFTAEVPAEDIFALSDDGLGFPNIGEVLVLGGDRSGTMKPFTGDVAKAIVVGGVILLDADNENWVKSAVSVVAKYSPNQPRDGKGRWTNDGGTLFPDSAELGGSDAAHSGDHIAHDRAIADGITDPAAVAGAHDILESYPGYDKGRTERMPEFMASEYDPEHPVTFYFREDGGAPRLEAVQDGTNVFGGAHYTERGMGVEAKSAADMKNAVDRAAVIYAANALSRAWNRNSNVGEAEYIQAAADRVFGRESLGPNNDWARTPGGDAFADAYVKSLYSKTQKTLAEKGITELTLHRGLSINEPDMGRPEGFPVGGETVRTRLISRPVSSFSTRVDRAEGFATASVFNDGYMVTARVPAKDILSIGGSGPGAVSERELLVLPLSDPNVSIRSLTEAETWGALDDFVTDLAAKKGVELVKYDPSQPRDQKGRWTSLGLGQKLGISEMARAEMFEDWTGFEAHLDAIESQVADRLRNRTSVADTPTHTTVTAEMLSVAKYSPDQPRDDQGRFAPVMSQRQRRWARERAADEMYGAARTEIMLMGLPGGDAAAVSAVREYSRDYNGINAALRRGEDHVRVADLDRAFTYRTTGDLTVFRGRTDRLGAKVGDIIADPGYVSTSLSEDSASFFATSDGVAYGSVFEIAVPKGTPAVGVGGIDVAGEREMLFERGSGLRVTGVTIGDDGSERYTAELVSPQPRVKKYSPSQPRDRRGRWVSTGGGSGEGLFVVPALGAGLPTAGPMAEIADEIHRERIQTAIGAVSKVHNVKNVAAVTIMAESRRNAPHPDALGWYNPRQPGMIGTRFADNPDAEAVIVHEFGHMLDYQEFGTGGAASRAGGMSGVMDAISSSKASARWRSIADADTNAYINDPSEVFARAYTQWVATRSGDSKLLGALGRDAAEHWEADDFEPVGKAMDEFFEGQGLLNTSVKKYSPSQPRDDHGRWTSGAGVGGDPAIGQARSGKTVKVTPMTGSPADHADTRMAHQAPTNDGYNPPITRADDIYPEDVYGPKGHVYYGSGTSDAEDKAAVDILRRVRGNPDAKVTVYRTINADDNGTLHAPALRPGDWVTPSKSYAMSHARSDRPATLVEAEVPAGQLYTDANSLMEWGYDPSPEVHE